MSKYNLQKKKTILYKKTQNPSRDYNFAIDFKVSNHKPKKKIIL
jgi:hypothetical protein